MRRLDNKGLGNVLLRPRAAFVAILLTAVVCTGVHKIKTGAEIPRLARTRSSSAYNPADSTDQDPAHLDGTEHDGWETVRMRVTAYCPCRKCCGRFADGITASGHRTRPGDVFVAADKKYPFGTELIIPGYNKGRSVKVLDRGGLIRGNRLDVFFYSHRRAKKWGVKHLDVKLRRR
ncbi:MAG: 3D domain-containing protein [Planctomycetota bacterium]